jgi:hypothetical protein
MSSTALRFVIFGVALFASILSRAQDSTTVKKKEMVGELRDKVGGIKAAISIVTDSLKNKIVLPTDSLNVSAPDSLRQPWRISPLSVDKKVPTSIDVRSDKITDARTEADSVIHKIVKPAESIEQKISSVEESTEDKVSKGNDVLNSKLEKAEGRLQSDQVLDIHNASLPSTSSPVISVPAETPSSPGLTANAPVIVPSETTLLETKEIIPAELNGDELGKTKLEIPGQEKLNDVTGKLDQVDSKLNDAANYNKGFQRVKQTEIPSVEKTDAFAAEKLANLEEIQALEKGQEDLKKLAAEQAKNAALIERYKDKQKLQKEIEDKAKNIANDKINKHSAVVKDAQERMEKAKKLNPTVKSFQALKQKRINEMKGKPFYERMVPGVTVQAYNNSKIFTTDWGLQVGYKISNRLLVGTGFVGRTSFSERHHTWIKGEGVYGYRAYGNIGFYKNFYVHAELASLHGNLEIKTSEVEKVNAQQFNFGLGKSYDISRKFKGAVVVLYCAQIKNNIPSLSKVNLRIEFNYTAKKRKKLY